MNHQYYSADEAQAKGGIESSLYRNVAEGGLAVCKVCNCYEGGLASECPGEPVLMDQQDRIYAREVDFVGGQWVNLSAATQLPEERAKTKEIWDSFGNSGMRYPEDADLVGGQTDMEGS